MSSEIYYFKEVLSKVGIILQDGDEANIFKKESSLIIQEIQTELENNCNNIQDFIAGVKYLSQKEKLFKKALLPSILQQIGSDYETKLQQQSVFRILLNVDKIQEEIILILLEEVANHAFNDEEETVWPQLLLNPLRYLPYIKDSETMTNRLLDILEIATHPVQLEILKFLPDIIPSGDHDVIATKLSEILNQKVELTGPIINCLNHLFLSSAVKAEIQDHILSILNITTSLKNFSLIFCFIITNYSTDLQNILLKSRNALDSLLEYITESNDKESEKVLTFEEIQSITINFKLIEGWISLMNNIQSAKDHKPIDLIILLMLHSIDRNRKYSVENIFKKKIKNQQLKPDLLEKMLEKYLSSQILNMYMSSILEISSFLLTTDPLCVEFATTFYCSIFSHKQTDKQQRRQIVSSLISLKENDGKKSISSLRILGKISKENLKYHVSELMKLLDEIEKVSLEEVKQIYELLCGLIFKRNSDQTMEAFQNTIHMLIRKQLSSFNENLKHGGIIGAVAAAKNIAINLDESVDSNESNLVGQAKEAAKLLQQVSNCISGCPIAEGLYYDQLAEMVVTTENLDGNFLGWLMDEITTKFQDLYISSPSSTNPINGILLSIQYNINSNEEMEEPIAIKIAELTIKENKAMLIFASLFRLLRMITYRQNDKNLSDIDALLGCGIILPEVDPDVGIQNYDTEQSKQVVDCLFHCINWFREVINAFVTQKPRKIKEKVLLRLKNLVELEELFGECMKHLPEHKLPQCYFHNTTMNKTTNPDRKRKNSANSTNKLPENTQMTTITTSSKPGRKAQQKEKEYTFREMDTDLILLLKYSVVSTDEFQSEQLNYPQLNFILKDIAGKLKIVTQQNSPNVFSHLTNINSTDLITDCIRLMPHINKHLIQTIEETKELLKRSDNIHDAHEMFLQPATELKISFSLILEVQELVLSWSGFQNNKNLPLLRECLKAFVDETSSQLLTAQKLILKYLKIIEAFFDYCLTLSSAIHLVNIVKSLSNAMSVVSNDTTPKKKLVVLSGKFLSVRWFNLNGLPESGAIANLHIDNLVKAHLNETNLESISNLVSWIQAECAQLKTKDDSLVTFQSITKANFPILYRAVCAALEKSLESELKGLTNEEHLDVWFNTFVTLRNLMDIVRVHDIRANLKSFLKKSIAIVKIFLSHGLPILEIMLRSHLERVIEILKTLQKTTRFIQNLCCHSKVTKDSTLMVYVPQMRLTSENLIYRVKAALVANNCSSGFWMGTLKNKDLRGEEILSQTTENSVDQQEDEDELPVDDESDTEISGSSEII